MMHLLKKYGNLGNVYGKQWRDWEDKKWESLRSIKISYTTN